MSIVIFSISSTGIIGFMLIHGIYRTDFTKYLFRFMCIYIISSAKVLTDDYVLHKERTFEYMSTWEAGFRIILGALIFYYCYKMLMQLNIKTKSLTTILTASAFILGLTCYLISYSHIFPDSQTSAINRICALLMSIYITYTGLLLRKGIYEDWEYSLQNFVRKISYVVIFYIPAVWFIVFMQTRSGYAHFQMVIIDLILISIFSVISLISISNYIKKQSRGMNLSVSSDFLDQYKISQREQEVLDLLLKGLSNKDIGEKLFISLSTTRTHISHLFEKTGVNSRMELLYKVLSF